MTTYRYDTFDAEVLPDGSVDERTAAYFEAVRAGFHGKASTPEELVKRVERAQADGRRLTAVLVDNPPAHALPAEVPVATFASFTKDMNIGFGRQLSTHLITWVTVRPTHRRRGLLRSLLSADLERAKGAGFPVAALTATEAGIYGRFGFGGATWYSAIELDTSPGFSLIHESDRRVEAARPEVLTELGPAIYERFQKQSPGAIGRQAVYTEIAAGTTSDDSIDPDRAVRAALHYDVNGEPDGYVSYRVKDSDGARPSLEIRDFVAVSNEAYRALWEFVGSIDLVNRVTWDEAAVNSPLPWMLTDSRRFTVTSTSDNIWLRILDVPAALEARAWPQDGRLTLDIRDPMGLAGGVFVLEARDGEASVTPVSDDAAVDLRMGIAELAAIYLGGADPSILARAGRIASLTQGSARLARQMFALERLPYSPSDF